MDDVFGGHQTPSFDGRCHESGRHKTHFAFTQYCTFEQVKGHLRIACVH